MIDQLTPGGPPIIELEHELLATDHCQIGYILAKEWRIPAAIAAMVLSKISMPSSFAFSM